VACRYYSIGRDKEEDREIEPYGLFFQWSHWYCVGRARDRGALRVFRVDRVRDIRPLHGAHARFEVPETFDVRAYLGRAPWELSQKRPTRVQVRFGFPESRWVQNEGVARLVEPVLDDGGAILEFAVRERAPFLRWLLTFREQVSVVKPKTVARQLEQLRASVAAMYE
jgi:predicted DNA-binding transcriptional regulator YafY